MTETKLGNIQINSNTKYLKNDSFVKPMHSQSYINSMTMPISYMPAICDRIAPIQNIPEPIRFQPENIPEIKFVKAKPKLTYILLTILTSIILCTALIIIITFGIFPCLVTKCHFRANTCINHAFNAECVCDLGYQGNGKEFCDECGLTNVKPNIMRVVGGMVASNASWPSAALIVVEYKTDVQIENDLVQITSRFIFEYEHNSVKYKVRVIPNKYYPTKESMIKIYVGVDDLNSAIYKQEIRPYMIQKVLVHPNYDHEKILDDIALLKLINPVQLNNKVQLACLPSHKSSSDQYPLPGSSSFIIGWGTVTEAGVASNNLKNAQTEIFESKYCSVVLDELPKNWNAQICAGTLDGTIDTCQGDSGGGLYVSDVLLNKTVFIAAGIVSYGDGCAKIGKPA